VVVVPPPANAPDPSTLRRMSRADRLLPWSTFLLYPFAGWVVDAR
jgi:hypothetical protein